jgi:heme-binding protein
MSIRQRGLICAMSALGTVLLATAAPAAADPPPNCTAADLAGVMTGVSAAMSVYLGTHPDVNGFFTDLKGMPREQQRQAVQDYVDANPQVATDLRGIRGPALEFRDRCDVDVPD